MEADLYEVLQAVEAVQEVVDIINDNTDDGELITQEAVDVIESFGDGEQGNNDIEILLEDIKSSLYGVEDGSYTTVQSNLEVIKSCLDTIDQRLDSEFVTVNDCLGFIATCIVSIFSWKILTWFYNVISR